MSTFTPAKKGAFEWVQCQQFAIVGPGKSYVLKGLIQLCKNEQLVVAELAPSGIAAHFIGGTTIHNCNSTLENGTIKAGRL